MTTSPESNVAFFHYFQQEVADLQEQIDRITEHSTTGGEGNDAIEHCSASITRLSNEVRNLQGTLPAHDKQTYGDAVKALSSKLQTVRSQTSRKQKFTFKNSAFKIPKNESAVSLHDAAVLASRKPADLPKASADSSLVTTPLDASEQTANTTGGDISGRSGSYISLTSSLPTTALYTDVQQCVIDTSGTEEPLPTCRSRNIDKSILIIPSIAGPIYLEHITNSIVVVGCHQFRMHNSSNCEVYLSCSSRPIIEDCKTICFAPIPDHLASSSDNKWDQVDDFKWLRAEQSPNWSILEPARRRTSDFWTRLKELQHSEDLSQSIAALELP